MAAPISESPSPKRTRGPGKKPAMDAAQLRAYRTERMRVSRAISKLAKAPVPPKCTKRVVSARRISDALAETQKDTQRPLNHQTICTMYKKKSRAHDPPKRMKNEMGGEDADRSLRCSQNFHGPW
eukprot:GILI01008861.1.p2 GENE.GILI01008861.1~~GILI01008861.1.p2  ORF type:complete len:125 (+),score=17.82 GILI01008861.1:1169-1543(+)